MKKIIICIILLAAFVSAFLLIPQETAYMEESTFSASTDATFDQWKFFCENYSNRTSIGENAGGGADYIESCFKTFGYSAFSENEAEVSFSTSRIQQFDFTYEGNVYKCGNVIGVKKSDAVYAQNVIIGAHYDNYSGIGQGSSAIGGEGAYDNGSGVALLLSLAKYYENISLPFNLYFVAYDASVYGFEGSDYFYRSLSIAQQKNILLAVNLDCIVCGDALYYYTDEVERSYDASVKKAISDTGSNIVAPPTDKKPIITNAENYYYQHLGLFSDNYTYVTNGVNSLSFVGCNWDSLLGLEESDTKGGLSGTSYDTVKNILDSSMYGEEFVKTRFEDVFETVTSLLNQSDFVDVFTKAKGEAKYLKLMDDSTTTATVWLVRLGLVISIVVIFFILKSKDGKVQSIQTEDIFGSSEDVSEGGSSSDSGDFFGSGYGEKNNKDKNDKDNNDGNGDIFGGFGV